MSIEDKILAKIRKLLALSKSSNVHEAAAAAAAAQRLMSEHEIAEAEIALEDPAIAPEPVGVEELASQSRRVMWKNIIASGLARANGARVWTETGHGFNGYGIKLRIAGTPSAITMVRYMLPYLCGEVERLARKERPKDERGMAWGHSFRLGAAGMLRERLLAEVQLVREEAHASGHGAALARIDQDRTRVNALLPKLKASPKSRVKSPSAYELGREAGGRIALGGHAALGRGTAANLRAG